MRLLIILPILLVVGYLLICGLLYLKQESLLFVPAELREEELDVLASTGEFVPWTNAAGERIGWKSLEGNPDNALLVCHGNGGFALESKYEDLRRDKAFQIYLLEYPGYAGRAGQPSAQALADATLEAIDLLHTDPRRRIWAMGISMGSGAVCAAAAARPHVIAGLILVTPFDSLGSAASSQYPWIPVRLLLRHRFDSDKNLEKYHGPVAFIVAGNDRVVPPELGKRLFERYHGPKRLWLIPGAGHNDRDDHFAPWPEIAAWLQLLPNPKSKIQNAP